MLEIALDADDEWDSSRPWQQIARNAAERTFLEQRVRACANGAS